MDSTTLAIAVKKAREEAAKVAATTAEKVARSIIPEKGDPGYTPVKGVDYFDGAPGYTPVKGVDYFDGKDAKAPVKGVDYDDGEPGRDANRWHLTQGAPDIELGYDGDFALDGNNSDIWHKQEGEWEFVAHLKAEMPMFQPPRAYSPEQIKGHATEPDVRYTAVDTTTTDDDEVIVCTAGLTVTLHTPSSVEPLRPKRIKRIGDANVTVTTVDDGGYILNVKYQAVDVQWTGSEWISL